MASAVDMSVRMTPRGAWTTLVALALAAAFSGCDVMGGGPSKAPPIPEPAPTVTPVVSAAPSPSPAAAHRKRLRVAGIR
jgi:hypothetical protein